MFPVHTKKESFRFRIHSSFKIGLEKPPFREELRVDGIGLTVEYYERFFEIFLR